METDELDPTRPMYDDDDPTSAPSSDPHDADPLDDDAPRLLVRADGSFDEDRGFVDSRSIVRVWIDENGLINKVRVSPSWRDRVGKGKDSAALATGLATAFQQAFTVINIARREHTEGEAVTDDVPPSKTVLSWESLGRVSLELAELRERIADIPAEHRMGRWQGSPAVGDGAKGKVRLELNLDGGYSRITFDADWLDDSRVGQICDAVPEAAKNALSKFVPSTYEPTEFDNLQGQARALRNELSAMMKRGFF